MRPASFRRGERQTARGSVGPCLLVASALVLAAPGPVSAEPVSAARTGRLGTVQSWAYQLQGRDGRPLDLAPLERSDADVIVIDYADGDRPFTRRQIERLQRRRDGTRRRVLAYLSIGEAEDYRYYWRKAWKRSPPRFLAGVNPEWAGNFKVRYWDPGWRRLLFGGATAGKDASYLDRILAAGFDGVYLDVIDAYEFFGPEGPSPERPTAAPDMCQLVIDLATYARVTRARPAFAVVPQNGATILDEVSPALARRYLAAVDGIGAEDTFFYGSRAEDNPLAVSRETLAGLRRFRDAGKVVLAVDYLTDPARARRFARLARSHGFVPYVGRRALDRLVAQPR